MRPRRLQRLRGTVSLVALCFVAVLGIVLASYLTICSRAMNLSNRSYQSGVAQQLAEFGLDEALRAFNKNSWGGWASNPTNITGATSAWTLDTTNRRASRTITFASGKLGQGVTATVKMRVDNYDANVLDASYSSTATYRINDLVGYNSVWYRCVKDASTGNTPGGSDYTWWVPVPVEWAWTSGRSYRANYDVVCYGGDWWLCNANHTSTTAFAWSNWTWISPPETSWTSGKWYGVGTLVYYSNNWYRCITGHNSGGSFDSAKFTTASWTYQSGVTYSFDDLVVYNTTWYRYINPTPTSGNTPAPNSYWEYARSGTMLGWNSGGIKYELGDAVYSSTGGYWYRCILAHTSSTSIPVTNTTYWSNDPIYSPAWSSTRQYSQNDTAFYNGVWYLSLANSNVGQNPATATTYWIGANTTTSSYIWNSTTSYASNNIRCYGGVWYKCLAPHTNKSPNDTAYWTPTWTGAMGITTGGAVVYAEATVTITGSPPIRTQLRAAINPAPLFPNALATTDTLTLSAGGTIDSYNSISDPGAATRGYSAVVASTFNGTNAVWNYGATIQGYIAAPSASTSPYTPYVTSGSNAVVKGTAATPSPTKADPTRISRSPSVPQFGTLPSGGLSANWSTTPKGKSIDFSAFSAGSTVTLGSPGATTPSRYYCTSLTIDGTNVGALTINGPVILYVQGNLVVGGSTDNSAHKITVTSAGSLEIHVGGNLNINQSSGGIDNRTTRDPKKVVIICDSTGSGTYNYSDGDNDFYGVIYAPYFSSTATGFVVDNSSVIIYGAVSAKKIAYSSDANVHYDTSLRYAQIPGVDQPYSITDWRTLPATEQATMP